MSDGAGIGTIIVYLAILIVNIAAWWKIFEKAGKPGWAVLVPIYNIIVFLEIVGKPVWWIVLFIIPIVGLIVAIICLIELLKKFAMPGWHVILAIFGGLIYFPYLAFTDAKIQG